MAKTENRITEKEVSIIKGLLKRGIESQRIHHLINVNRSIFEGKPVINFGRIHEIKSGKKFDNIPVASNKEIDEFLRRIDSLKKTKTEIGKKHIEYIVKEEDVFLLSAEGDDLEYKLSPSISDKIITTIAALSNNKGGLIVFGVDDKDYKLKGLDDNAIKKYKDLRRLNEKILDIFGVHLDIDSAIKDISGKNTLYYIRCPHSSSWRVCIVV